MIKEHLMDQAMDLAQPLVFDEKDADRKKKSIIRAIKFALECGMDYAIFGLTEPYPGT